MILATARYSHVKHDNPVRGSLQQTLASAVEIRGVSFVSNVDVTMRLAPADANQGICFRRIDVPDLPLIPARTGQLLHNERRTTLALGDERVEMTEHVLSALHGMGIDNAIVELDGCETPAADGSSDAFVQGIQQAGTVVQDAPRQPLMVKSPLRLEDASATIEILPTSEPGLRITYSLDYDNPGIGRQEYSLLVTPETFVTEISRARTFVLAREVQMLWAMGIGRRLTARDLLVFDEDGSVVDNALRFPDECVRHKILDIIGDLALVGRPIWGHVRAARTGHRHNVALAKALGEANEA